MAQHIKKFNITQYLLIFYSIVLLLTVELIKESCIDEDADFYDQIKTRLYSPSADRYICFTKKGKIRPMVSF